MKKASNVKLSLRKLFIAMLAAAPVAILPSPVLAVIPTNLTTNTSTNAETVGVGTIIQVAGSGSLSGSTGVFANISVSDKSVLVWSKGSFNIAGGETYHFAVPGGSVLNKVGYMANGTLQSTTDNVNIAGSLTSSGRVFILANGDITVTSAGGANVINTSGGLYLSTIQESNDFNFTSLGTLTSNGTNRGTITLGGATPLTVTGGSLEAVSGNSIVAGGATLTSGDLILRTVGSGNAITLGSGSAITVSNGNLVVSTNNGIINQTNAVSVAGTGKSASLTSGTANITLTAANDFPTVNISANNSNVTVTDANSLTLGTVAVGTNGTLVVSSTAGSIDNAQPITSGNVTLNAAAGNVTLTGANTPSGFAATAGAVSANFASAANINGVTATGGNVTLTSTGALTLAGNIGAAASTNVTLTGTSITSTGGAINGSTGTTNVSLNATSGGVTLGGVSARSLNVKANNGSISQLSGSNITTAGSVAQTFDAGTTGSVMLTSANNTFGTDAMLNLVGSTVSVTNNNAGRLIISSANTTAGLTVNTLLGGGNVLLGSGSGTNSGVITVAGPLAITTNNSSIDDDDDLTIRVGGAVTFNTNSSGGGNITLDSAIGSAGRGSSSYGQISINATGSNVTIHESQSLNLGTVSSSNFVGNSVSGNILIGGTFTTTGNVTMNAASGGISQTAPVNITASGNSLFQSNNSSATILDNPSNMFAVTGNIRIINGGNNIVNAASGFRLGNGTTNNLTLTTTSTSANVVLVQNNTSTGMSGNNIVINSASPIEVQTTGNIRNLTLNTTNTSATSIFSGGGGNTTVNGTLTLTTLGGVNLNGTANLGAGTGLGTNITGTVVLSNVIGDVTLVNQRNLTLTGSSVQSNVTAVAGWGPFANTWNLNLGNLNVRSLTANVVNGEFSGGANPIFAGQSGNITQLANTSVHVENDANFITFNGGNIVVANNGNSFGRVSAYTRGSVGTSHLDGSSNLIANGNVTIVEDGTLKVGNMITAGTASLTSRFGSVIEDTTTALTLNVATLSANSVNGSILLGGTTNGDTTTGTINAFNVNAPSGAVAIKSLGNVTIGATAANSLSVRSGNNIAQSGALNIFGTSVFNATNSIALNDSANNFGPVTMITANANAALSITEANTLNLRQVTIAAAGAGNGTFTATSINGSIIDTGLGGVKPAGIQNSTVTAIGTGSVSLNAINGDIIIDDPSSDFPTSGGVAFNAKNVTLSVLGNSTLTLGVNGTTSVATGNLLVKTALGSISNPGALNVTGTAAFETGAGNIVLNNAGNQFGSIRFSGNQVNIVEANDTVLLTGSSAIGAVVVQSGGNLTVSNAQPASSISFGSTVALQAAGTIIIPKLIQAAGTVSVNAPGLKDLGALSVSADLSGINPIFLPVGTTNFVAPQP